MQNTKNCGATQQRLWLFLCKLLKVMGTKEMLTGVSLGVNTVAGRSIKYTSITHIHFLSAVCVSDKARKRQTR